MSTDEEMRRKLGEWRRDAFADSELLQVIDWALKQDREITVMRGQLARASTLPDRWESMTQDGQGVKREHWQGQPYVDGQDSQAEHDAAELRAALAPQGNPDSHEWLGSDR